MIAEQSTKDTGATVRHYSHFGTDVLTFLSKYLHTCTLWLYLYTVAIPVHCGYTCTLWLYLYTVAIPVHCGYTNGATVEKVSE